MKQEKEMKEEKVYKVYAIGNGVVIDHIPAKEALKVIKVLGLMPSGKSIVTMGMNLESKKLGHKDVLKVENRMLSHAELNKIALIAPKASVNIIKDSKVVEKVKIKVPKDIISLVKCNNPQCITNHERVETIFRTIQEDPLVIKCHFCERFIEREDISLL